MPRRKQIKLSAKETAIYDVIVNELMKNPLLAADYDMDTIELSILKKKSPPKIMNIDMAISNLQRYIAINGKNIQTIQGEPIVSKKDIARMLKVSRPTLDKWIKDGFITPIQSKHLRNLKIFPPVLILEQLQKQKK